MSHALNYVYCLVTLFLLIIFSSIKQLFMPIKQIINEKKLNKTTKLNYQIIQY
jgi:hypothetical protein